MVDLGVAEAHLSALALYLGALAAHLAALGVNLDALALHLRAVGAHLSALAKPVLWQHILLLWHWVWVGPCDHDARLEAEGSKRTLCTSASNHEKRAKTVAPVGSASLEDEHSLC